MPPGTFGNPEPEHIRLSHGYDETKAELDLGDFQRSRSIPWRRIALQ